MGPSPSSTARPLRAAARAAYGACALSLLAVLLALAILLATALPRLTWRRGSVRALARAWLAASGLRCRTLGLDSLPPGACVLVANHASYLDGIVMIAALPPRFGFVVKREASSMPLLGLLLRRLGSEFVDRHTAAGRHRDARRVVRRAEEGHSLVFFPEGTFDAVPGLKRFHIGAFVAATRGNVPVVPAVIHGARSALPSGTIIPRPQPIVVEVLTPLGGSGEAPEQLRCAARQRMLARLGEPDLAREREREAQAPAATTA